jgi:hypothetical protein
MRLTAGRMEHLNNIIVTEGTISIRMSHPKHLSKKLENLESRWRKEIVNSRSLFIFLT